jgi:plasmid stabilization system protein ParE
MPGRPKPVKLHPEAQNELRESVMFYRERAGERWADRFKERITEGLKTIAANPERHPGVPELAGVQKIRLKQFPFSLLYLDRPDHIWVVAVAHGSRQPGY